jgi:GNAT superfamily N-acetyltransferase
MMLAGRRSAEQEHGVVIREVIDLDASWMHLTQLFLEFERYNQDFEPRELLPDWNQRWKQRLRLHEDRLILLAWVADEVAGCIAAVIRRNEGLANGSPGYLTYLYVREAFRGSGIGRALLGRAEVWCRARGAQRIEIDVFEKNSLGKEFWSRSGFKTYSRTMRKTLGVPL